jgi:FdhE protein
MEQEQDRHTVSGDVDLLRRERPHARAFVDPFMGLLLARPPLVAELLSDAAAIPAPMFDPARLGQGACLEPRDEFPVERAALRRAFEVLQPVLTNGFRDARTDLMVIGQAAATDDEILSEAVAGMLGDRRQALAHLANSLGVEPRVLGFWCVQLLTPLAMARGRVLSGVVADAAWNRGYCPVCGSWPGIMRRSESGGLMTCSFCATTWLFTRRECPYCEAPGPSGQVYAVPGFESERVMVCRRCNHYLAEIADDALSNCAPEVAALALIPLELLARQHGHIPATMDWRQMVWV